MFFFLFACYFFSRVCFVLSCLTSFTSTINKDPRFFFLYTEPLKMIYNLFPSCIVTNIASNINTSFFFVCLLNSPYLSYNSHSSLGLSLSRALSLSHTRILERVQRVFFRPFLYFVVAVYFFFLISCSLLSYVTYGRVKSLFIYLFLVVIWFASKKHNLLLLYLDHY